MNSLKKHSNKLNMEKMIPIFRPSISQEEITAVTETLNSGWWGSGLKAIEFEQKFADYIGVKYACSLNSCTAALHLAGKILNLPEGSEVITSPLTFVSTAYIANYNNLKIVFADVEEDTLNIDPNDIKKKITEKTKLIVPIHYGGHPCKMDEIMEIAKEHKLYVIEDCAHAAGGYYKGKKLGSFGDMACFSFQAVKNIATGDGGMLVTNNEEWAKKCKILRWVGINRDTSERITNEQYKWDYNITEVGYKFQMPDILASIGLVQLKRLEEMNKKRKAITKIYNKAFSDIEWIKTPVEKDYAYSANHNYVIKIEKNREKLISYLTKNGISTGIHYLPIYKHPIYQHIKADCPVTEKIWTKIITLPLYPDMTDGEISQVIDSIKRFGNEF